jgi:uncharacterized protein VirK/YbjX
MSSFILSDYWQTPELPDESKPINTAIHSEEPSAARAFFRLVRSRIAARDTLQAYRFIWRAARSPIATKRWLRSLDRLRLLTGAPAIPFYLARKPGRDFLHHGLSYEAKIELLTGHYRQLISATGPRFTGELLGGRRVVLAEFPGKASAIYRIGMARNDHFRREGEIIVDLRRDDSDRPLATLSLVLGAFDRMAPADLWIGGLQGCKGDDSKTVTVATTRDLWGLRPKDLMMHAAYGLGEVFGAASLKAIANEGHIDHRPDAKVLKRKADYDSFWRELDGVPIAGGFFLLPSVRRRRAEDEVPAAKRKAWRARHALADDVEAQILRLKDHHRGVCRSVRAPGA